jgi:hypothetical protein
VARVIDVAGGEVETISMTVTVASGDLDSASFLVGLGGFAETDEPSWVAPSSVTAVSVSQVVVSYTIGPGNCPPSGDYWFKVQISQAGEVEQYTTRYERIRVIASDSTTLSGGSPSDVFPGVIFGGEPLDAFDLVLSGGAP